MFCRSGSCIRPCFSGGLAQTVNSIKAEEDPMDEGGISAAPVNGKPECLDIMAQQLKFIGCLKIMMEELSTLATGFEVDGGLLRYQLYIWLEREVEALKQLCNYGATDSHILAEQPIATDSLQSTMRELFAAHGRKPTLHEVMLAEKADFEAKVLINNLP